MIRAAPSVSGMIAKREGETAVPAGVAPVDLHLGPYRSRDAFDVSLELRPFVRLHDSDVDRRVFAEHFLKFSPIGRGEQVAEYLRPQVRAAMETMVAERDAASMLDEPGELVEPVRKALARPLFAVGLVLERLEVSAVCEALSRRRVEEAAEAARSAAAERAGELLRRFEDIRRQNPQVPAGTLLMGLPKSDREEALRSLLRAAGERMRSRLFAVAGDMLCEIDPVADEVLPLSLPRELGPLRSVQAVWRKGSPRLVIGARDGVYFVDPDNATAAEIFEADVEGSPFGFSNLAYDAGLDVIHATHSDVGLVSWQVDLGTRTTHDRDDFGGEPPRQILMMGDRLYVAANDRLFQLDGASPPEAVPGTTGSAIVALAATPQELLVISAGGEVIGVNQNSGNVAPRSGPAVAATDAAALAWLEDIRLALAPVDSGTIPLVGPHDDVQLESSSTRGPYRALAAAPDLVAAVSSDRQRLVCWRPWERDPLADLHLISRTRSRLADVTLLSA